MPWLPPPKTPPFMKQTAQKRVCDRTEHSQTRNPFQAINRNRKKANQIQIKLL